MEFEPNSSVHVAFPGSLTLCRLQERIYWELLDYSACQECLRRSGHRKGFQPQLDSPYGNNQRTVARSGIIVQPHKQPGQ